MEAENESRCFEASDNEAELSLCSKRRDLSLVHLIICLFMHSFRIVLIIRFIIHSSISFFLSFFFVDI